MNKRVLIIGSHLCEIFAQGVIDAGWEVMVVDFKLSKFKHLPAILKKRFISNKSIDHFITKKLASNIQRSKDKIVKFKPTEILILRGYRFDDSVINFLKDTAPLFLWAYDTITRYQEQMYLQKYVKRTFVIDRHDADDANGILWRPIGYSKKHFYREQQKDFDIILIGRVNNSSYASRLNALYELNDFAANKGLKIAYVGTTGSNKLNKQLVKRLTNIDFMGKQNFADFAQIIRKSRICINIHQDDGFEPINPMFFAIAAGVCQVCDHREYFSEWLEPNTSFVSVKQNELSYSLEQLLKNKDITDKISMFGEQNTKSYQLKDQLKELFQ